MAGVNLGNVRAFGVASVALTPALIVLNTTAEQTFSVPGLKTGDVILSVNKPTAQAGLGIVNWRVSAADTIGITFSNNTGGSITPTAGETYLIAWARPDSVQAGVAGV